MVLTHLFATHGVVPIKEIKEQENKIRSMTFHLTEPFTILYGPTERLKKLAGAARVSSTP